MILENGSMVLGVQLNSPSPTIMIKCSDYEVPGIHYSLTKENIEELRKLFIGEWVELVTKEDLNTMLQCVKAASMEANKIANAAVESSTRLSELYERYSNESGT